MEGYSAKVIEISKEVSAKQKIQLKDTTNCISLDEATNENDRMIISPDFYAVIAVHNEKSEDKDYEKYVVVDRAGNKYVTGSKSFFTALRDIMSDMAAEAQDEEYDIEVYRRESANYKGKTFITCSLA